MAFDNKAVLSATSAREVVLSFIEAMNNLDYKKAREYVHDELYFIGVMGTRNGAEAYFRDMEKMKFQYAVQKAFEDGDDVCLWYDITMSGKSIFSSGWYHVEEGRINWLKVVFDPRPLL